jgi:hypothetical protein
LDVFCPSKSFPPHHIQTQTSPQTRTQAHKRFALARLQKTERNFCAKIQNCVRFASGRETKIEKRALRADVRAIRARSIAFCENPGAPRSGGFPLDGEKRANSMHYYIESRRRLGKNASQDLAYI